MLTPNGILNQETGIVEPAIGGLWSETTTWDTWVQWNLSPVSPLIWMTETLDLVSIKSFNLLITTVANGTVSYEVYTSDTGAFAGEETTTAIAQGATNVPSFSGRFVQVAVQVAATTGLTTISSIEIKANDATNTIRLNDINTSTLAGSASARTLVLPRGASKILNMEITPKTITAYNVDFYVTDYPTSTFLIPKIVSKSSTPQIALIGVDNIARDGIVDITLNVLPQQYMDGNNLKTR